MRLSDVKGERTFEVIADIIEPVYRIAQDEAAVEMLSPKPCPEAEEYAASLDLAKLVASLTELVSDPALMGFLASAAGPAGETPAE